MRQADINNQGICDYSMYGILAKEYFDLKQLLTLLSEIMWIILNKLWIL